MVTNQDLAKILRRYSKQYPQEDGHEIIAEFLRRRGSLSSRRNFYAHVTASAVVLDQSLSRVLLIQHRALGKLIQPGGHLDERDRSLVDAARRELREETGVTQVMHCPADPNTPTLPFDIDIHTIPASPEKNEPEHYHIDCRFLFVETAAEAARLDLAEVTRAEWLPLQRVRQFNPDFARVVAKVKSYTESSVDDLFFRSLGERLAFPRTRSHLVEVCHIIPDAPPFIVALERCGASLTIIPKPNSIVPEVLRQLKGKRIERVTRFDLRDEKVLRRVFNQRGPYYVVDIGGYFANETVMHWSAKTKKIRGIVEDTENGLQKYLALKKKLTIPVISVARSTLKINEDSLVGQDVAYYTEFVMRQSQRFPRFLTCGLIGYGKLGRGIAHYLFNQNIKPLLYDRDPLKMVEGYKDGCVPMTKEKLLAKSDLLFCATGAKSLTESDFLAIKTGAAIASVTSSDDEFQLDNIRHLFSVRPDGPYLTRLENRTTHLYLINKGNAVNFLGRAQVGNFINLVRGEMFSALRTLMEGKLTAGIHELPTEERQQIADLFLRTYVHLNLDR